MGRTVSSTISTAVAQPDTTPIYLVQMDWAVTRRICTWDADISWNSQTWLSSGATVVNLDSEGGTLKLPIDDTISPVLPWLDLVTSEGQLGIVVEIWEHHTDRTVSPWTSDAVSIFKGEMDEAAIGKDISIKLIEDKQRKAFPPTSVDQSVYTHLLTSGTVIIWRDTVITVD